MQLLEACSADVQRMSVLHAHVPAEVALLAGASADWTMCVVPCLFHDK